MSLRIAKISISCEFRARIKSLLIKSYAATSRAILGCREESIGHGLIERLGQTISDVLSAAGADIVAVSRDVAALEETRKIVENNGHKCMTIAADLRTTDAGEKVVAQVTGVWGAVDILVNNAGICISDSLLDFSVDDWDASFNVNLRAAFLFARAVAPRMIAQKSGKIINLSSQISNFAMRITVLMGLQSGA